MLSDFTLLQFISITLIFIWSGFVRSGLGFGGATLGIPLMLLVSDQPIYWIPIIGFHLLFFSTLTLSTRWDNVDWNYLKKSNLFVVPAAIAGVVGLINLPNILLLIFIYGITFIYALLWIIDKEIHSSNIWVDRVLLVVGGYVAGTSLTGAPLLIAVYMRNVDSSRLRSTLFVVWFIIVTLKMLTLISFGIPLNFIPAVALMPAAAIGHIIGLKTHNYILARDKLFKRIMGCFLLMVCSLGLWTVF
jgi:uncharacterized protein